MNWLKTQSPAPIKDISAEAGQSGNQTQKVGNSQLGKLQRRIAEVIRGKDEVIQSFLTAVVAGGSILLEDLPGVGKTTLAKTFARLVDLEFHRIQCTPDLLPADVYGFSIFNSRDGTFSFRPGPVFCNILLVDEINRASPRTQSALLEAMAEQQVTVEGERRVLQQPFMVIATQNPVGFQGTYPLPEAQLDRFLFHLAIDYPDRESEISLLYEQDFEANPELAPILDAQALIKLQAEVKETEVHRDLADYIVRIVDATRNCERIRIGCSPRGAQMLFRASQAAALVAGRDFVIPDDVQSVAAMTLAHRIVTRRQDTRRGLSNRHGDKRELIEELVRSIAVPV